MPLWAELCRGGQPVTGALAADVAARLGPLRADVARARAEAAASWESYWLAEAGDRFVTAIFQLTEASGDARSESLPADLRRRAHDDVVAAAESLRSDLALLARAADRPPPWSPLDPTAWLRGLPRDGIDRLGALVRAFEADPDLADLLPRASEGRSLRYVVADLADLLSRLPGELRDVIVRGRWLAAGELGGIGEMLYTFLRLAPQVDAEMARLRDSIAALPATEKQLAALGAWHDAWRAWATPAVHLDAPLLSERLEYGAGTTDEVLLGQAVLATVVQDAEGLGRILADTSPRGLPVGEVQREFSRHRSVEEPQERPAAPESARVAPTMRGLRSVARIVYQHARATAELTMAGLDFVGTAPADEDERAAVALELQQVGDAARWVADSASLVADGLVGVDQRRRGSRIDIGARELPARAAVLFEHVSALGQHLASMGRTAGPEGFLNPFHEVEWRIDQLAAGCRRLERELPHLSGVIRRAGDVYWMKVADTSWVVGADVDRIRAVAADSGRHAMIVVADDISGADHSELAEVLAEQLDAMRDPPSAVVLAPRTIEADPSWRELSLPAPRGNTALRVHPDLEELGDRVRAHVIGLGGTGPVASPARPTDLPGLVGRYLDVHERIDRYAAAHRDRADGLDMIDPLGEIAMSVPPLVRPDGRVDVDDLARMIARIVQIAADDAELSELIDQLGDVGGWPALVVEVAEELSGDVSGAVEPAPEYRDGVAAVSVGSILSVTLTELAALYLRVLTAVGQPHLAEVADRIGEALRALPAPPEVLSSEFSRRLAQVASVREAAGAANEIRFLRAVVDRAQDGPETRDIVELLRRREDDEQDAAAIRALYQPVRVDLPFAEFSRLAASLVGGQRADMAQFNVIRDRVNHLVALADRDAWLADDRPDWLGVREPLLAKIVTRATSVAVLHDAVHQYVVRHVPERDTLRSALAGVDLLNPAFLSHHRALAGEDRTLHPLDHAVLLAALMRFGPEDVYHRAARLPIRVLDQSDLVHAVFASVAETSHSGVFRLAGTMYVPSFGTMTQLLTGIVHVLSAAPGADDGPGVETVRQRNIHDLHETLVAELESMGMPHADAAALALPSGIAATSEPPSGDDADSSVDYKRGDRGEFVAPEQHGYATSSDDVESVARAVSDVLSRLGDLAGDDGTLAERRSSIQQVVALQLQIQAQADAATAAVEAYRDATDPTAEVPQQFRALVDLLHQQSRLVRSHWPQGPAGSSVMATVDPVNPLGMTKITMGDDDAAAFAVLGVARAVAYLESVAESDAQLGVPAAERFTVDDTLVGQALTAVPLSRRGIAAAELADRIDEQIIDDPYAVAVLERRSGRAAILPTVSVAAFCSALVHEHQHRALGDLGPLGVTTPERGWVDEQAASRQEYRQLAARQGNQAACVRAEQVFWQAAIRAADNYGLVFPAAPGRVAPTGDAWLADAEPGEILQIMPNLPSPVVSDEAVADADLAAISEQLAAVTVPDPASAEAALPRQVRGYLSLHQRIEAFCAAHPDRFHVRNFDPLDETGMLGTTPRVDWDAGRVDARDLARIIAKVQLVCAAGDDSAPALRDLLATLRDVSEWPALAVRVVESTYGISGADLRPQLADGVVTVPVPVDDPPSLLDLAARYVRALAEATLPDMAPVQARIWSALSGLPAPAKVLRHEYSDRLASERAAREATLTSTEVAFLHQVVRSALRTEVDGEAADRLAALVRSRLGDRERVSTRRELPRGRSASLGTSYVRLTELNGALNGLANMLDDEQDDFAPVVRPLSGLLDDKAWPREAEQRSDLVRTTARNLVDLHERALAHPVTQPTRSRWREADVLNPVFLMHHRPDPPLDEERLHPFDHAIVLAAVARFAPARIAAAAARVPIMVVSARHLADPALYRALLDSPRGVFRSGGVVYVLPSMPLTDLISGLVEVLTPAPASAPTESPAEQVLHREYARWSNLDTLYDNLVTDLRRAGMSIEDAAALALPPGAEQTHAESRISNAALAAELGDRLPAELRGAITSREVYDLVVRYRTERAAPAPGVSDPPAQATELPRHERTEATAGTEQLTHQAQQDAARLALREQFVFWHDTQPLYEHAIARVQAGGLSREQAIRFVLPHNLHELYGDTAGGFRSTLTYVLLQRLPLALQPAITAIEAYNLVIGWISLRSGAPQQASPEEAQRLAGSAVPLALQLQAKRWHHYQSVFDSLVVLFESSGFPGQDVVDFVRPPEARAGAAETGGSSGALAAVLGELPPGRWPSLALDEGIELLWPYLEQRAADDAGPSPIGEVAEPATWRLAAATIDPVLSRIGHGVESVVASVESYDGPLTISGLDVADQFRALANAARAVADASHTISDAVAGRDPGTRGGEVDRGMAELRRRADRVVRDVAALRERLTSAASDSGATPVQLSGAVDAITTDAFQIDRDCRELAQDLPHVPGLIHQAGDLNWLKVSDRLWIAGTDPGRILGILGRDDDRGDEAILVADDISGTDPEPLAAVLAEQLSAMRARPPFIVLAPDPTDDAGPWDELPLPALGDSILYVHRDVYDLGRAVQAHLGDPGGPDASDPDDPSTGPPPAGGTGPAPEPSEPPAGDGGRLGVRDRDPGTPPPGPKAESVPSRTGPGPVPAEALEFIAYNVGRFVESGGQIAILHSGDPRIQAFFEQAQRIRGTRSSDSGVEVGRRYLANALDADHLLTTPRRIRSAVAVAYRDGEVCAAVDFAGWTDNVGEWITPFDLGSAHLGARGAGTAAIYALAEYALERGRPVLSSPMGDEASRFHTALGRSRVPVTRSSGSESRTYDSNWSLADLERIVGYVRGYLDRSRAQDDDRTSEIGADIQRPQSEAP
jgi:hypothetical protein